mgnify:CR=1 FL=1
MMLEILPRGIRFDGHVLVAGFHGIGATGYWTVKYLVQKLKAERVAFIDSNLMAPICSVYQGKLVTPHEILKKDSLAFLKIDVPVYKEHEVSFYREFAKWVVDAGFREVALIGGLDSSLKSDDTTYRIAYTKKFIPRGELAEAKVLEDEHVIVGPVAIMLNYFEMVEFPAFAILAYASTERVDPRATATAVSILSRLYDFEVDITPLIRGAEAIEAELYRRSVKEERRGGESIYT